MGNIVMWYLVHLISTTFIQGELVNKLHHYETLQQVDIISRMKRDLRLPFLDEYQGLKFNGFGRQFHLELSKSDILSSGFPTKVIHQDGQMSNVPLAHSHFYNGRLKDEEGSCTLYVEDGVITGHIKTSDEEYYIEPLWRHSAGLHSGNDTMIMYRMSDVKWNITNRFCGTRKYKTAHKSQTSENINVPEKDRVQVFEGRGDRRKRNILGNRKVCRVLLIADNYFCQGIGGGSVESTMNYMIGLMDSVNNIYKSTRWSDDLTGVGFEISGIYVHDSFSPTRGYNMKDRDMDMNVLLQEFSKAFYKNKYCAVHLLTYQGFDGAFGLAYVASWRQNELGGICSKDDHVDKLATNAAVSTSMNNDGERQLTVVAMATVAHEFGHGWGSEHDPDTGECMPSVSDGGKFLMLSYSQMVLFKNNLKFSPCSVRSIYKVLEAKGYDCFTEESRNYAICGNGRIDDGETCDSGTGFDNCCENCQLVPDAFCSAQNYPCCINCQLAVQGTPCFRPTDDDTDCKAYAVCTGTDLQCPDPVAKPDGTECLGGGKCLSGLCTDFCIAEGLLPCSCAAETGNACHRCCRSTQNITCRPYNNELLRDGSYCDNGVCQSGVCVKTSSHIKRTWDVILTQITNSFSIFMKNNIVFFTTLFTAILFIPIVIIIIRRDANVETEDKKNRDPLINKRDEVVLSSEDHEVVRVEKPVSIHGNSRTSRNTATPSRHRKITGHERIQPQERGHKDRDNSSMGQKRIQPPERGHRDAANSSSGQYSAPNYLSDTFSGDLYIRKKLSAPRAKYISPESKYYSSAPVREELQYRPNDMGTHVVQLSGSPSPSRAYKGNYYSSAPMREELQHRSSDIGTHVVQLSGSPSPPRANRGNISGEKYRNRPTEYSGNDSLSPQTSNTPPSTRSVPLEDRHDNLGNPYTSARVQKNKPSNVSWNRYSKPGHAVVPKGGYRNSGFELETEV